MDGRLASFGWQALVPPRRLKIDGIRGDGFQIGRAWSSAGGRFESISSDGDLYALLPIEGGGVVIYDGEEICVDQDHLILLDGAATIAVDTPSAVGRYIWRLGPELLRSKYYQRLYGEPLRVGAGIWKPIAALISAMIARPDASMLKTAHVRRANEHLLADIIGASLAKSFSRRVETRDPIIMYSERIIEQCFHRQSFNVVKLARSVGVSERTLRRKYASIGTAPRAEISRRRAVAAIALADEGIPDAAEIAERAGFTSVAQMRVSCERLKSQANVLQRNVDLALASSLADVERESSERSTVSSS